MDTIVINKNEDLSEILTHHNAGKMEMYLLQKKPWDKLGKQVNLSNRLMKEGLSVYIEVKFCSDFSKRPKRLEVVSLDKDYNLCIYKFSSSQKFDRDASELEEILDEVKNKYKGQIKSIHGILAVTSQDEYDYINKRKTDDGA